MASPKKYTVSLADDGLKEPKAIIRRKNTSKILRCQILIDLDEAYGKMFMHQQSARSNEVCMDGRPYRLHGDVREPWPDGIWKTDSGYVRNGACSIFAFVERPGDETFGAYAGLPVIYQAPGSTQYREKLIGYGNGHGKKLLCEWQLYIII